MIAPLSLRGSVLLLASVCVAAAQGIAFALLLALPPAPQPAMTARAVAVAYEGAGDKVSNGLGLNVQDAAPFSAVSRGYPLMIARTLEAMLRRTGARETRVRFLSHVVALQPGQAVPEQLGLATGAENVRATLALADVPFPSFEAAVQRTDGKWTVMVPHRPLLSPESLRLLAAFAASILLLAPIVWWSARRLTRPLATLAAAAESLSLDGGPVPLEVAGAPEVRSAAAAFNAMRTRLAAQNNERTAFVAAIAHDLRTPLTSLRLRAETAPAIPRARMVQDIARMEALVADFITFVGGNHPNSELQIIDLSEFASDCVTELRDRGVDVTLVSRRPTPVLVRQGEIRRAIENLILNAHIHAGPALVRVEVNGPDSSFIVTDDGPGIPDDQRERVFEPFVRLESSRSRSTGGSGLGLAIARNVAHAHGGTATLRNLQPRGFEARITLPTAQQ